MADYIYNPAESIKQGFQQTQSGLGNIFTQIIQQQQRDYTLAESAFQNIEALKKDVNIFGQKAITAKSNELLKQAGSAILKDGKLDYSKLGEIRQGISDIKDLKAGYDVGAKEYERMLQLGIANKDNLVSFEKFYKDLSAKMSDENLIKNPQDLQRAMADTYSNNLDDSKMFIKSFSSANPLQKTIKDVVDPKTGALMRIEGQVPKGWDIGADGKVIPKAPITTTINGQTVTMDYADQELARLKATDPDLLATMRKKAGFAGSNMSDKDIVKFYIDNKVVAPVSAIQVQSKAQQDAANLQVEKLKFDVENAPRELALKERQANASIASSQASAAYYNAQTDMLQNGASPAGMYSDKLYDPNAKKNINYNAYPLQMETPTAIKLRNGKDVGAIISDVAIGDNGQIYAKVGVGGANKRIVKDKKNISAYQFHMIEPSAAPAFLRDMKIAANSKGDKNTKKAALASIQNIENAFNQMKQNRADEANKQAKPAKYGLYKGYNLDVLVNAKENQGQTIDAIKAAIDAENQ